MNFDIDNMYCGAIKRGDIFMSESNDGQEFVVVLQDDILNQSMPTVICACIEPHRKGDKVFVNEVLLTQEEIGLGKDGICMLHKVKTLERVKLVAKKGELKKGRLQEIFNALDVTTGRFRDRM